ncbi:hypothetical protein [Aquimarina brevivitae]|uniref:Uncharacterized protein n=1 Tax=Aquimarina brevivitae TaxID=323412 RepID=A0A4Q7PHX5_9FLAO|nr:hypothetical protein [Aquimarina brevivitae]RZT00194.1 hypothetical protein EV197_1429 [Aquimarina brevivitae]
MKNTKIKQNAQLTASITDIEARDIIALTGFVKEGNGNIHLYYDLQLSAYLEINKEDLVDQVASNDPQEPSYVYVKANAKVREVIAPSHYRTLQNFLDQPTVEDLLQELTDSTDPTNNPDLVYLGRKPKLPRRTRRLLRRLRRGRCYNWNW